MKNGTGQLALILILMLALFLQIEGVVPDIFAGSDEPIILMSEKDGLKFDVIFYNRSFTAKDELTIKVNITNKSDKPIGYYEGTGSYEIQRALSAELYSMDDSSKFTDKFALETDGTVSDGALLEKELIPGEAVNYEFTMLPYFIDKGKKNIAASGDYIFKLCYNKGNEGAVEVEFPVAIVKRFGRMNIKG